MGDIWARPPLRDPPPRRISAFDLRTERISVYTLPMTTEQPIRLTAAQARDLSLDIAAYDAVKAAFHLSPAVGTLDVEARTLIPGPDAVALLRARAAQLNPGYAKPFLLVAAKVEEAAK